MSTEATRQYNWVNDKNASVPITASRMDTEFDNIITKLNQKALIKSSAPSAPIEGMLWYDSTNKVFKVYRNSAWVEIVDAVNDQTIAGVKTFSDQPVLSAGAKTDTISEKTADTGVTVDGCLIKDGKAKTAESADKVNNVLTAFEYNASGNDITKTISPSVDGIIFVIGKMRFHNNTDSDQLRTLYLTVAGTERDRFGASLTSWQDDGATVTYIGAVSAGSITIALTSSGSSYVGTTYSSLSVIFIPV